MKDTKNYSSTKPQNAPAAPPRIPVHRSFAGADELAGVAQVFESGWLGHGQVALDFEARICELTGARHALSITSGTAALFLAMEVLELQPGDEVIVPSLTFTGAIQAIVQANLKPIFCEVETTTFNIDVADVARRITPRTRAIMPVHYAGAPCDLDALQNLANEHKLFLVDDAAHAFGSTYKGKPIGAPCDMTCFSFDPIKTFTCGDGGAITTDDDELAARLRLARNIGLENETWKRRNNSQNNPQAARRSWDYRTVAGGHRNLMNNLNAAIGLAQLAKIDEVKSRRQAITARYDTAFENNSALQLQQRDIADICPFTYALRVTNGARDNLMQWLRERGIGTTVPFPLNHQQIAYAEYSCSLPVTEKLIEELIALPMHAQLSDDDVTEVIAAVTSWSAQNQ